MKKASILLKTALVFVLAFAIVILSLGVPTFSWFTRPQSQSGNSLEYTIPAAEAPIAYDGHGSSTGNTSSRVTMTTYISNDDGISFSDDQTPPAPVDFNTASNRQKTLGTASPDNRVYYKTILTNTSEDDQNVSLYVKNFNTGSTGEVCIGVNVPIKAFKNYTHYGVIKPSPSKLEAPGEGTKRVYFEPTNHSEHTENWDGGHYYVYYCSSSEDLNNTRHYNDHEMYPCSGVPGMYYDDIPADANQLFFCVKDWDQDYQRTQNFTNLTGDGLSKSQSLLFKLNGNYTGYNNAWCSVEHITGANLLSYYSTAHIPVGDSYDMGLDTSKYTGEISYSISSGSSYASVNSDGRVTVSSANPANTPIKLKYTVSSSFGDVYEKECTITTKNYAGQNNTIPNAPIVTNLLIPGTSKNTDSEPNKNVQEVYWFIQNGDEMYGPATENASIRFDAVYLGV